MKTIAVIGAGSWGTALSLVLADNGFEVALYARRKEQAVEINTEHTNRRYLPDVVLHPKIRAYSTYQEVLSQANIVILVLPTAALRTALREMSPFIPKKSLIVHSSKGLEPDTYKRISQMIEEEIASEQREGIVVLSGPSHAEEVSLRSPTTVVASAVNVHLAEKVQDLFINENFRVYTHTDVVGVEIGGALKNIIALGAGLSDGLGYGDNAKAALMTRGLTEITRLGMDLRAPPLTFSGLTGLGDLIATCTSRHSRNWRCGFAIGQGRPLNDVLDSMGMVVEGVRTTKAAYQLSRSKGVKMPITQELFAVLFEGKPPRLAVDDLMRRGRTHELEANLLGDLNRYF